jgi:hypothetical protein
VASTCPSLTPADRFKDDFLDDRQSGLRHFLVAALRHPSLRAARPLCAFLTAPSWVGAPLRFKFILEVAEDVSRPAVAPVKIKSEESRDDANLCARLKRAAFDAASSRERLWTAVAASCARFVTSQRGCCALGRTDLKELLADLLDVLEGLASALDDVRAQTAADFCAHVRPLGDRLVRALKMWFDAFRRAMR